MTEVVSADTGALGVDPPAEAVREAVARALAEDLGPAGDLTAALVPEDAEGHLTVVARESGVVAGRRCAEEAFAAVDPSLRVTWHRPDASAVVPGDVVAEVAGSLRSILTAERTALNFLGHLSGVATLTRRYVDAAAAVNPAVRILDTRKTTPGLRALEKAAVRAGGGHNHRSSLSDAVLVKDNHLAGTTITSAVDTALARWPGREVEVECDSADQVTEAVAAGATAVLLDNMSPREAAACARMARRLAAARPGGSAGPGRGITVEVSGGMRLDTVAPYAAAGVDSISVGALTHSAPVLDLGLDLVVGPRGRAPREKDT